MNWYVLAIISAISLAAQLLTMKRLQRTVQIQVYLGYIWLGASLVLLPIYATRTSLRAIGANLALLMLAGGASWAGNLSYNIAIRHQSNLGYIEALSGVRLVLVYLASLFLFGANLTPVKLLALLGAATAFTLVSEGGIVARNESSLSWVAWSMVSGIMFALLIICAKVLSLRGVDSATTIGFVFGIAGILYFGSVLKGKMNVKVSGSVGLLLISIACAAIGNLALFMSYSGAPNLAYPEAISNGRIMLLYLASVLTGEDKMMPRKAIGVVLAFGSIAILGF